MSKHTAPMHHTLTISVYRWIYYILSSEQLYTQRDAFFSRGREKLLFFFSFLFLSIAYSYSTMYVCYVLHLLDIIVSVRFFFFFQLEFFAAKMRMNNSLLYVIRLNFCRFPIVFLAMKLYLILIICIYNICIRMHTSLNGRQFFRLFEFLTKHLRL